MEVSAPSMSLCPLALVAPVDTEVRLVMSYMCLGVLNMYYIHIYCNLSSTVPLLPNNMSTVEEILSFSVSLSVYAVFLFSLQ